jgi:hypothetical protein
MEREGIGEEGGTHLFNCVHRGEQSPKRRGVLRAGLPQIVQTVLGGLPGIVTCR